jgi:hypothetical protein
MAAKSRKSDTLRNAGDVLSSESDPATFLDRSRDLVATCHVFVGRPATLRFHNGGMRGLTVWLGDKNIGYIDAPELNDLLRKAITRARLDVEADEQTRAQRRYLAMARHEAMERFLPTREGKAPSPRAAEPESRGARDSCNVVTFGGWERKKQCSDQTS